MAIGAKKHGYVAIDNSARQGPFSRDAVASCAVAFGACFYAL